MFTKKNGLVILAIMLVLGIVAANIHAQSNNQLIGTWVGNIAGAPVVLTFDSNGSYTESAMGETMTGTYTVEGNKIIIKSPGRNPIERDFELNENILNLTISGMKITFDRR